MLRLTRLIFSIVCLLLSIFVGWVLIESFHEPRTLTHVAVQAETLYTIQDGCFELGHSIGDDPHRPELGWHLGYVRDGVGELQLPSFFPGFGHGGIYINMVGPRYSGTILAGYWVLIALLIPALPLLLHHCRVILLIIFPTVLWCGILLLWHRSYQTDDLISVELSTSTWGFGSDYGSMLCSVSGPEGGHGSYISGNDKPVSASWANYFYAKVARLGRVVIADVLIIGPNGDHWFYIRYWLLMLFLSVVLLPIVGFETRRKLRLRRARHRSAVNLCVGCGYDLRASKEQCPECGRTLAQKKGSA